MTKPEQKIISNNEETEQVQENDIEVMEEQGDMSAVKDDPEAPAQNAKDLFAAFDPNDEEAELSDGVKDDGDYEPPPKKNKESPASSAKKYVPKYKKEWENKPELKSWLSESIHGNTYFYCKFCKKDYRCGISDINKHMSSQKHKLKAATPAFKAQKFKFRGLLCPVFTPFQNMKKTTPDIDTKFISRYAKFLATCNVKGILINDIIGEGMSLTMQERFEMTDVWAEACKRTNQFLMVQVGGTALKDVIELARHAERRKVGAIVVLPDLYNKPNSHLDLIRYLKVVSEVTRDVPLLYHHNPKVTGVEVNVTSLLLDIIGEIDSFVGIIYSTNDIQQSTSAMLVNKEKFTVFMGTDEAVLAAAASGFTCIMSSSLNILPKVVEEICVSVRNGKMKDAQSSQNFLTTALEYIYKQGEAIPALKAATSLVTSNFGTNTREPLQAIWEGTLKTMQAKLHELGLV